jgi:hypothetical protein
LAQALEPRVLLAADDSFEPNNTILSAADIGLLQGANQATGLVLNNDDWYRFRTAVTGTANDFVAITFQSSQGDIDLALYDTNGVLLRYSQSVNDREEVSLNGLPAGTYYIYVYGYNGITNPSYTLLVNAPTVQDDVYEPNNTRATATDLGTIQETFTLTDLACLDNDYFMFTTTAPGTSANFVAINFLHAAGDLDLALYNSAGKLLRSSTTATNGESITLRALAAGTYYVRVYGYQGAINASYSLTINAPFSTLPADAFEPNDTLLQTTPLGVRTGTATFSDLTIHNTTDLDFFSFTTLAQGTAADFVSIAFANAAGDLDMVLYDALGNALRQSAGRGNGETISLAGLPAGTYIVGVNGYAGARNRYTLTLRAPAAPQADLPADRYEPNNSAANATDLRTISGLLTLADLSIHTASDQDVFAFTLGATGAGGDYAAISFLSAAGDLDLQLYSAGLTLLATSDGSGDGEQISLAGRPAGTYYLVVYGYQGQRNDYTLTIQAPVVGPVRPDAFEEQEPIRLASSQTLTGLSIHDPAANGDVGTRADTFIFTTLATGRAGDFAQINFNAAHGYLTLTLQDASRNTLAVSATLGGEERVSLAGRPAGTYFLVVDAQDPNVAPTHPSYDLTLSAAFQSTEDLPNWTVLVYLAGDNNLEAAAIADVNEMEAAAFNPDLRYAVMLDRIPGYDSSNGNWTNTRRSIISPDNDRAVISSNLASVGEKDMSNPQTLADFIAWGASVLPAQHYALIIWNHGAAIYGAAYDDSTGNEVGLSLPAIRQVLAGAPVTIDVLGFDACLMATAEVLNAVSRSVDYLVASEESEGNAGWDYTSLVGNLQFPATPRDFASAIVQASRTNRAIYTLSATVARGNPLDAALAAFVSAVLNTAGTADFTALDAARRTAASYDYEFMRDLGSFMMRVKALVPTAAIRAAAEGVVAALGNTVINNFSRPGKAGTGLTIYLPDPADPIPSFYGNLPFAQATGWRAFLAAMKAGFAPATRTVGPRDWAESNDLRATATDLRTLTAHGLFFEGLSLHSTDDVDWYRFTTLADGAAGDNVILRFVNAAGDLSLLLYDSDGNLLESSQQAGTDSETVALTGLPAGEYYLCVLSPGQNTNPAYMLEINAPPAGGDWAENNDTPQKATAITVGVPQYGLTLTPGDVDWYIISASRLPALNPLVITATHADGGGSLQITLLDEAGNELAQSAAVAGGQRLEYPAFQAASYLVRVTGTPAGEVLPYGLTVSHDFSQTLAADSLPPAARLAVANVLRAGLTTTRLTVVYTDPSGVDAASVGAGDIIVTGPRKFSQVARFLSKTVGLDGRVTARYAITAPGGTWDLPDRGVYTVTLRLRQIRDNAGNTNAPAVLGQFRAFVAGKVIKPILSPGGTIQPARRSAGLFSDTAIGLLG